MLIILLKVRVLEALSNLSRESSLNRAAPIIL